MSAIAVIPVYNTFLDVDGNPVDDGYVWIGQPNLDPIANPQNAYWDEALTQLVTQPVRTRQGYPLNGSSVGKLYTAGSYSILVRNENGSDVIGAATFSADDVIDDLTLTGTLTLSALIASTALALNANKEVVSITNTGTGNNVLATSPTLVTPSLGAATATSLVASANAGAVPATVLAGSTVVSLHGADATAARQMIAAYGGNPVVDFRRANGTAASPTAVLQFQGIGAINGTGYNGSAFSTPRAAVALVGAENWSSTANGAFLTFTITPLGGTATTEVGRVETNGRLEFGNAVNLNGPALTTTAPADLYIRSGNTYVDNTTAASGTVAHGAVSSFGLKGIAAVNSSVTYTNASTIYVHGAPGAGSNVTITNPWSVYVADGKSLFNGDLVVGTAALATNATAGFLWAPSCAGVPTGVPTAPYTNAAAIVADTTNNRLYVRIGSTWRYATLT